ncbi:kinase-like protein [Thozetella sp. PMI_491]|nr:kinase-like protein [Thozetella sp. PMI_491]
MEGSIPTIEDDIFDNPRLFSDICSGQGIETRAGHNLVAFLAAVQRLQIRFLPITWQQRRRLIGAGGTSQVSQGLIDAETSLAFKRVSEVDKLLKAEEDIYQCVTNEITILRHPAIRDHPNITQLEGICWDVSPDNPASHWKVWPVLVFEKAPYSDLYHFVKLDIARELGINDRLKLCIDIGSALAHMHVNHVIHGDIKPQNILIFREESGAFAAKVADFGYSAWHASGSERIELPRSWPWYAPECDEYPEFTVQQALRADVFSFGMLCLWLLFDSYLSGARPLPEPAQPRGWFGLDDKESLERLSVLKIRGDLSRFTTALVTAEPGLDPSTRLMLQQFLCQSLADAPTSRPMNAQQSMECLIAYRYKKFLYNQIVTAANGVRDKQPQVAAIEAPPPKSPIPKAHDFSVSIRLAVVVLWNLSN